MNKYAAQTALECLEANLTGDKLGTKTVIEEIRRLANGDDVTVLAGSSESETERLRVVIATMYMLLYRADPTEADYRGAVIQAMKVAETECRDVLERYCRR